MTPSRAPIVFTATDDEGRKHLATLRDECVVVDPTPSAVADLFRIDFPYIGPETPEFEATRRRYEANYPYKPEDDFGVWVHFPWRGTLVHLPDQDTYLKLRTARNQFLIQPDEQQAFHSASLALAGLSVGSAALHSIVMSGGPNRLKIADSDDLAVVNLNRLHASVCELGEAKSTIAAQRVYELNPFQQLEVWPDGISTNSMEDFLLWKGQPVDLFIEEVDDLFMKIQSRLVARRLGIPVVMATDNGDNAMIDVERFDLEPDRPLFHGRIEDTVLKTIPSQPTQADRIRIAATIVGLDITPRTQRSMQLVGSQIPTWPQLGNAATLSGAAVSYVARRILTDQRMPSGRYHLSLDAALEPAYSSVEAAAQRRSETADFNAALKILFGVDLL